MAHAIGALLAWWLLLVLLLSYRDHVHRERMTERGSTTEPTRRTP